MIAPATLQPYASRTGTRRNLDAMRTRGWRLFVVAGAVERNEGMPYAIDNGAWSAFKQGRLFDEAVFERLVDRMGDGADFIVAPDIVEGGLRSLDLTVKWLERLEGVSPLRLIPVQDGMAPWDVEPLLERSGRGIFVGGSSEWKWKSVAHWAALARRKGVYLHVGRVNSTKRILECARVGANSFDGTSASIYALTTNKLDGARRQPALLPDEWSDL